MDRWLTRRPQPPAIVEPVDEWVVVPMAEDKAMAEPGGVVEGMIPAWH